MSSGTLILIVVGIGIVLIVLSFITRPSTQRHYEADIAERQRRFKEHGVRFEAYITEIQKKRGRDIGPLDLDNHIDVNTSAHPLGTSDTYSVIAMAEQPETGKWYTFTKDVFQKDLTTYKTGRAVIVYMDPKNTKRYWMEDMKQRT